MARGQVARGQNTSLASYIHSLFQLPHHNYHHCHHHHHHRHWHSKGWSYNQQLPAVGYLQLEMVSHLQVEGLTLCVTQWGKVM